MHREYKPADMNMVKAINKHLLLFAFKIVIFNLLKERFLMKFNDAKRFSAYVKVNLT